MAQPRQPRRRLRGQCQRSRPAAERSSQRRVVRARLRRGRGRNAGRQGGAVRQSLFTDTKQYTYDPKSTPERVVDIRKVILDIDENLESTLDV